jgi:hypothetical protein
MTTVVALVVVAGMLRSGTVKASAPKPSHQSKSGVAVAYAKADILNQVVLSFGGKGTTAAEATSGDGLNFIEVTFTGKYPKDITADQVIINATAQTSFFPVANAIVSDVNPTQLVVQVSAWVSNTQEGNGEIVFFTVYLGR